MNPYKVHRRTVRGLNHRYPEFIVKREGGSITYGPFRTRKQALQEAQFLNLAAQSKEAA